MNEYVLLLHENAGEFASLPPDQQKAAVAEYQAWGGQLAEAGHLVGGQKLAEDAGRVMAQSNGHIDVSTPALAGESIGGLFHVRADSYERVVELARSCPHLKYGNRIEIRQVDKVE